MITILHDGSSRQVITPTMFPDGTSQVWKLDLDSIKNPLVKILWNFYSESELIHLNQLCDLLVSSGYTIVEIFIPFLPYARQDKEVSNELTFAKSTFLKMLPTCSLAISTLDIHSTDYSFVIHNYNPFGYIKRAIKDSAASVLVFPDAGAYQRYHSYLLDYPCIVLDKVRDQSTGKIVSLEINEELTSAELSNSKNLLIIDDICDGGATFINASLFLHERFKCFIALYVTHGIFSRGYEKLIDSGISEFYTTKSLAKNVSGYDLE